MTTPRPEASLRTLDHLVEAGLVAPAEKPEIEKVLRRYALAITPAMAGIIAADDPQSGVQRQFVPSAQELVTAEGELDDPIGDEPFAPVKGIVHRYEDRVLLKLHHACPVYCRFCFRREQVGPGGAALNGGELDAALAYIAADPGIWEVILSGGDPLILPPARLRSVIERLCAIDHVGVIRIHSRVPVVSPERIDAELVAALRQAKPVYVVLHCNHPDELGPAARAALARLADAGLPLLSQSVLLRGINDDAQTLTRLFRRLVENRVKPYYLHHADLARGTGHFRTSIGEGQALMGQLRGKVSGLCQPTYVLDIPGGHGKVPIGPAYVEAAGPGAYALRDPAGGRHMYRECLPAEAGSGAMPLSSA